MKKIIFIIVSLIFLYNNSFSIFAASNPFLNKTLEELAKDEEFRKNVAYPSFLESIENETNYDGTLGYGRAIFDEKNKKLIIGCSPVAYMSFYGQDLVENNGYDIVGFGGIVDKEILKWLKLIDKKYDEIVFWGCANDIFNYLIDNKYFDYKYVRVINSVISELKNHLSDDQKSEIVFVNVKDMQIDKDGLDEINTIKYNVMAHQINDYVKSKGIRSINITADTGEENSEWYLHYNNKNVFKKILSDIESVS